MPSSAVRTLQLIPCLHPKRVGVSSRTHASSNERPKNEATVWAETDAQGIILQRSKTQVCSTQQARHMVLSYKNTFIILLMKYISSHKSTIHTKWVKGRLIRGWGLLVGKGASEGEGDSTKLNERKRGSHWHVWQSHTDINNVQGRTTQKKKEHHHPPHQYHHQPAATWGGEKEVTIEINIPKCTIYKIKQGTIHKIS